MSELYLGDLPEEEIAKAIVSLPAHKFIAVISTVEELSNRYKKMGGAIASAISDDEVDDVLRNIFKELQ